MASFFSFLGCCGSSKKALEADAEVRRARIVTMYNNSRNASLCTIGQTHPTSAPPLYSDAIHDRIVHVTADEKDRTLFVDRQPEPQNMEERSSSPSPTFSDESSVVSIPSTRLSGITSTCTGDTVRLRTRGVGNPFEDQRESWRYSATPSEMAGVAPPSYYAPSDDGSDADTGEPHPVMQHGWLARLRTEADARVNETRTAHG